MTETMSSGKILVVDDEPIALEIFKAIFEEDFSVATANCGENALELVPVFGPDVVVLDAVMPGLDGWEVCRRIKSGEKSNAAKVIMVSAKAIEPEQKFFGYESGADDYVAKPFIHEELLAKAQVWTRLKQAEDRLREQIRKLEAEKCGLEKSKERLQIKIQEYAKALLEQRSILNNRSALPQAVLDTASEIRIHFSGIAGRARLLSACYGSEPAAQACGDEVLAELDSATGLIDQLLDLQPSNIVPS